MGLRQGRASIPIWWVWPEVDSVSYKGVLGAGSRCRGGSGPEDRPRTPDPPLQTMYSVSFHYPVHWVRCHSFLT